MRKILAFSRIAALFLLLLLIGIAPAAALEKGSRDVLNESFTYSVNTELGSSSGHTLNLWEKIALLNSSSTVVQLSEYQTLGSSDDLLTELLQQLQALQDFGALPGLPAATPAATATQKRYISPTDPQQAVTVWVVNAKYNSCSLFAYLDAESYTVYDIFLNTAPGYGFEQLPAKSVQGYIDYLYSFDATPQEELCINAGYSSEKVYLSLILANTQNGLVEGYSYSISSDIDEYGR